MLGWFTGHLGARPNAVFMALVARLNPGPDAYFSADPVSSLIIVQGGWWYRAEFRVVPDETGSLVEQTLLNVGQRMHWAGPIVGRKAITAAPADFRRLLRELRDELE